MALVELTRVLSIRAVTCVACRDPQRLVMITAASIVSRCYVCGDMTVTERTGGAGATEGDPGNPAGSGSERGAAAA